MLHSGILSELVLFYQSYPPFLQSYYKAKFLEDKTRVERLFKEADAHGFNSVVGYVSLIF